MSTKESLVLESNDDSIDLIALVKQFWSARKFILKTVLIFIVLGLVYALLSKNFYTASATIVPVTEGKSVGGSLGGLASLAGINLGGSVGGNSSGEISPMLYPEIVGSIPYKLELLQTKISVPESDSLVTYQYYFEELYNPGFLAGLKKYTIGLPGVILGALKGTSTSENLNATNDNLVKLNEEEFELIKVLEEQISLNVNDKEGFVSLSVTMPEAKAAAQMTLRAQELLQEYALKFKTQKSKEQLTYIEERFKEKQKEFDDKKLQLALFQDQNNNINSAVARTKLLQLQSEYDLAFTVYTELAKQLETQRLQVKKDTPIFTILKPVTIPNEKAGPKRALILIGFTFLGIVFSLGYIYIKGLLPEFKTAWNKAA
ncbi:MAG: hypothetical protein HWE16_03125 [Gammaproteobacteria bacterium]|nr:hypothetical protein [Gammaproteobacteria bacterium]